MRLIELVSGDVARLSNIERFSTHPRIKSENVAEHSYYVVLYCKLIGEYCAIKDIPINMERLLSRAILHDLDEVMSGDIVRPFKYYRKELRDLFESVTCSIMEKFFSILFPKCEGLYQSWRDAKKEDNEGIIVSFSDLLSVYGYSLSEIRLGNSYGYNILNDVTNYLINLYNSIDVDNPIKEIFQPLLGELFAEVGSTLSGPTVLYDSRSGKFSFHRKSDKEVCTNDVLRKLGNQNAR